MIPTRYAAVDQAQPLSKKELLATHRRYLKTRDETDCLALFRHHYGFAVRTAMRYVRPCFPEKEAISAAVHGLLEALHRYRPSKGAFTTFSFWWMLKHILRQRAFCKEAVKLPVTVVRKNRKIRALRVHLGDDDVAVARAMGVDVDELLRLESVHETPATTALDGAAMPEQVDPSPDPRQLLEESERPAVREVMLRVMNDRFSVLPKRERDIIRARHKADPDTFAEIGRRWGITGEAARLAYNLAMQTLSRRCRKDLQEHEQKLV